MTAPDTSDNALLVDRLTAAWTWTTDRVADVGTDDLLRPTPCDDFDLGALLDHLAESVERFTMALGGSPSAVEGAASPADRSARLRDAHLAAWEAADLAAPVELPFGLVPASVAADLNLAEIVLHGWDVGRATGERADVPEDLAADVLAIGHRLLTDEVRGGAFAPAVTVPDHAGTSDRMVAFYGRHP